VLERVANYLPDALGDGFENLRIGMASELLPKEVRKRLIAARALSASERDHHPRGIGR